MAITILYNQAIAFNIDDTCKCDGDYCQPIELTDTFMLEGIITANDTNANRLHNGSFDASDGWTLGTGFSISGGKLNGTAIANSSVLASSTVALGLRVGVVYKIVGVIDITSGTATTTGVFIKINDDLIPLPTLNYTTDDILFTAYYTPTNISSDIIEIGCSSSALDFNVQLIQVIELSSIGVQFAQTDGTIINTWEDFGVVDGIVTYPELTLSRTNGKIITYEALDTNPVKFQMTLNFAEGADDETPLTEVGCQTLCIFDSNFNHNRIINGNFAAGLDPFTSTGIWTWSSTQADYAPGVGAYTPGILSQSFYVEGGVEYTLEFSLSIIGSLLVQWNDGTTDYPIGLYNSGGTKTATFTPTSSGIISLKFEEGSDHPIIAVDSVSVLTTEHNCLLTSDCLNIQTNHECTLLFTATNDDDAFAFTYPTSPVFTHQLRLEAKIDVSSYPEEKEEYLFSDNSRRLLFARTENEYEVLLMDAPNYIHSCLRMMRLNDTFTIDGVEYIAESSYDLKRRKTSKLKQSAFTVKDKTGISSNYSCG